MKKTNITKINLNEDVETQPATPVVDTPSEDEKSLYLLNTLTDGLTTTWNYIETLKSIIVSVDSFSLSEEEKKELIDEINWIIDTNLISVGKFEQLLSKFSIRTEQDTVQDVKDTVENSEPKTGMTLPVKDFIDSFDIIDKDTKITLWDLSKDEEVSLEDEDNLSEMVETFESPDLVLNKDDESDYTLEDILGYLYDNQEIKLLDKDKSVIYEGNVEELLNKEELLSDKYFIKAPKEVTIYIFKNQVEDKGE